MRASAGRAPTRSGCRGVLSRRWARRYGSTAMAVLVLGLLGLVGGLALAGPAAADPSPDPSISSSPSPSASVNCDGLIGPGKSDCEHGNSIFDNNPAETAIDPLAGVARGCAHAASWIIGQLSKAVDDTTRVDFTNGGFLRQYAVVFAASTFLTLVLWLLAVAKRAARGVPFTTALSEAIGFLWLTVIASAFTPLVLYTVVNATDAVTDVIASATKADTHDFFGSFSKALDPDSDMGGGSIMLIIVSLVSVVAAGVLMLELMIRAAMLYVGALLGTAVYAGLVDRNLWHHVRRWAGIMVAVILVKPVIVVVLALAGALAADSSQQTSAIVSGLSIILLAIFASFAIYRFVPGFGDDMAELRNTRKTTAASATAAFIDSPAALLKRGIQTHSSRPQASPAPPANTKSDAGSGAVSSGIAAHSSRGDRSGTPVNGQAAKPPAPRSPGIPQRDGGDD